MRKRQWMADKLTQGLTRISTTVGELRERAAGASTHRLAHPLLPPTPPRDPDSQAPSNPARRQDIRGGADGPVLVLDGRVLDSAGRPLAGVRLDFWQSGGQPRLHCQGYQVTDRQGRFRLTAIRPAAPPTDPVPPVLNVALRSGKKKGLTTRLYFPDHDNQADPLFDPGLLLSYRERSPCRLHARFDFVLPAPA